MLSFHDLYERHSRDVYRFALFLSSDATVAEDLTADTFVRAWTARGSIRDTTIRAYLLTITRNLWRDRQRRAWRLVPLDESVATAVVFQAQAEHAIDLGWAEKLLQHVASGDRDALLLFARDGLSYDEIAQRLGIDAGAVKSRIFRARRVLNALRKGPHYGGVS
jgi:RNA polymerase sigma-70 factor, ECF subfamily